MIMVKNNYKFTIFVKNKRLDTWTEKENYPTSEQAEKKVTKSYQNKETKIIGSPSKFKVGIQLFTPDGLYGYAYKQTNSFLYIQRPNKPKDDPMFFLTSDICNYYNEGRLVITGKEYDNIK